MRLRQICLVAEDLENSLLTLSTLLDSPVMFKDPSVAEFGLDNGLIMTGGDFVEIVSPLPDLKNTAAERQLNRCGDSFYMAIFQCKKAEPVISHVKETGGRAVWEIDSNGVRASHFHPKDFGGAIVSVDSMGREDWQSAHAYWQWAKWPKEVEPAIPKTNTSTGALKGLRISARDHKEVQSNWARYLQRPEDGNRILFSGSEISFHFADIRRPQVTDVYFQAGRDPAKAILERAESLNLSITDGAVSFGGISWHFESDR